MAVDNEETITNINFQDKSGNLDEENFYCGVVEGKKIIISVCV